MKAKVGAVFNPRVKETEMTAITQTLSLRTPSMLRKALWLDVLSSGGMAALLLLIAGLLAPVLGLDAALVQGVGLSFIPFVA